MRIRSDQEAAKARTFLTSSPRDLSALGYKSRRRP